jgi:serine/threonine protein kinase
MELSDGVLRHLREVAERPDLSGTRYQLEEEIGRGGIGVVYAARDRDLDRRVAVKVMEAALAEEAPLIARLEHPGIVPVYERGTLPDGRVWYSMKLVAGQRLDRYVQNARSLGERLRVFRRVGEAVGYAHSCGVLHRDLKPQNVMVGAFGEVYVMDWGVAAVAGTPAFRAPESQVDERSDVYALGALLRFLVGQDAAPALTAVAAKAMSAQPEARYAGAAFLLDDIARFEEGLAVEAWREPLWHGVRRFGSRNAVLLWLLVAFAVVKAALYFMRGRS